MVKMEMESLLVRGLLIDLESLVHTVYLKLEKRLAAMLNQCITDLNSFRVPSSWMNSHSNSHGITVLPALNAYCEDEIAFF